MIQPVQKGAALLHDIETTQPKPGQVAIWWLGQSGYAIKSASALIYIDLYLSEHLTTKYANTAKPHIRMTESPIHGGEITNARYVFASHKHSDHLDPGTLPDLFAASPDAQLLLPGALVDHAVSLGLPRERLIPTNGDENHDFPGFTVYTLPSSHPNLDYDPSTGYPFIGFVFDLDGIRLYHSGDTIVYPDLAKSLRPINLDIAFLPINGRAGGEGTPPNMNAQEAVTLAKAIGEPLIIPHHYDMFTFNTADVGDFAAIVDAANQPYRILHCAEKFIWSKS